MDCGTVNRNVVVKKLKQTAVERENWKVLGKQATESEEGLDWVGIYF